MMLERGKGSTQRRRGRGGVRARVGQASCLHQPAPYPFGNGERARLGRSERRPRRSHVCLESTWSVRPPVFCSAREFPEDFAHSTPERSAEHCSACRWETGWRSNAPRSGSQGGGPNRAGKMPALRYC